MGKIPELIARLRNVDKIDDYARIEGADELARYQAWVRDLQAELDTVAARRDGVREELSAWFNSLPCDSVGKEHFDRLCQIVGLAPDNE